MRMGTTICFPQGEKMEKILIHDGQPFMPESMLPVEALNWARYRVGVGNMRLESWKDKTVVTFWRTGEYAFYKIV